MRARTATLALAAFTATALADPYTPRTLTPDQATQDAEILRDTLTRVHAGYGRYVTAAHTDAMLQAIIDDAARGTTDAELFLDVSRLVASLRCEHTKAELPQAIEDHRTETASYLPFTTKHIDGRVYINTAVAGLTPLERGDELLAINTAPIGRILEGVTPLISVDGWTDHTKRVDLEYSSEYLGDALNHFYPFLYGWPDEWTVTVRDHETGRVETVTADPIRYPAYVTLATGARGRYSSNFKDAVDFEMIDDSTGLLTIETFVNYRQPVPPDTLFDPVFDTLKEAGATTLVLDLRACGGGSDDVPRALIDYLTTEPTPMRAKPAWVRTNDFTGLRDHLTTWDQSAFNLPDDLFTQAADDSYIQFIPGFPPAPQPSPRPNAFTGELIILTSNNNASGATHLIANLKDNRGATLVGQPTGGSAEGCTAGVLFTLTLPNSGIRVPAMRSWNNATPITPGMGVTPDVLINETLDSWLNREDPTLNAALEL